eukprot:gene7391-11713_t
MEKENEKMKKLLETWDASEIIPNLFLGSQEAEESSYEILQLKNIKYVLTAGFGLNQNHVKNNVTYTKIKAVDISFYNILDDLPHCIHFIDQALSSGCSILVHCQMGISRSASIVIGYLMKMNKWPYAVAENEVKRHRKIIRPNSGFKDQLIW